VLDRVAALLEAQDANPYRVNAYRKPPASWNNTTDLFPKLQRAFPEKCSKTCRI